jgi:hypothetical protein
LSFYFRFCDLVTVTLYLKGRLPQQGVLRLFS